jgi:hypothetical protein
MKILLFGFCHCLQIIKDWQDSYFSYHKKWQRNQKWQTVFLYVKVFGICLEGSLVQSLRIHTLI